MQNQLSQIVKKLDRKPAWLRYRILSYVLGKTIHFVGTAGVKCLYLSHQKAIFKLPAKRRVKNHIGTIHAAASALVAETASGLALAMHLPDTKMPLLKSMQIQYIKRSTGWLTAEASLTQQQIESLHRDPKGSFIVTCEVLDEISETPILCQMEWAWTEKRNP
ncbi:MAG: DUF4442 domain-containing protein [Enterobacterales bacterium]|nr:DUF4442 domain-containing protein [Enterobacterales bacterium]